MSSDVHQGCASRPSLLVIDVKDLYGNLPRRSLLYSADLKIRSASDPNSIRMDVDAVFELSEVRKLPLNVDECTHMSAGDDSVNLFGLHSLNGFLLLKL